MEITIIIFCSLKQGNLVGYIYVPTNHNTFRDHDLAAF